MSRYGFRPYVRIAERHANAAREMDKLRKKGKDIQPIKIEKKKISRTFWGNAWCDHIESFSDYDNRLPRGRTLVRNGSVCHLAISKESVDAIVSGSELYKVKITIKPLPNKQWLEIKKNCAGKIASLLDLLSGKLSDGVMQLVCDPKQGLFPPLNGIKLSCSCPDWATMCKHVAAVLYGVGSRLDHSPEKLFELRSADHHELIDTSTLAIDTTQDTTSRRRRIASSAISDVFDIDLSSEAPISKPAKVSQNTLPKYFSGIIIRKKRKQLNLSQAALAKRVGVSAGTISNWEAKGRHKVNLRKAANDALLALWQE